MEKEFYIDWSSNDPKADEDIDFRRKMTAERKRLEAEADDIDPHIVQTLKMMPEVEHWAEKDLTAKIFAFCRISWAAFCQYYGYDVKADYYNSEAINICFNCWSGSAKKKAILAQLGTTFDE